MATSITDLRRIMTVADIASVDEQGLHGPLEMSQTLCNIMENMKLSLPILIWGYKSHTQLFDISAYVNGAIAGAQIFPLCFT